MSAKPTDIETESDFQQNGDPVELDYLLSSDLPHDVEGAHSDDEVDGPGRQHDVELDLDAEGFESFNTDHEEEISAAPATAPAKRGRPKAGTPKPPTVDADGKPLTVYQRLVDEGLLRKLTDIVMAKVSIPWHLRADATQEVHTTWATLTAKPEFQRNQLGQYAFMSGQHAALKLRRNIGAVVVIPGALFRTGRDTTFMESIGAAVNPKDVDDYKDSLELATEPMEDLQLSRVSESFFEQRLGDLNLSTKQRLVAHKALVERMAADDIAIELGMDLMYVERLLNQVTNKLTAKDGGEKPEPASRKPRKPAKSKDATPEHAGTEETDTASVMGLSRGTFGRPRRARVKVAA